MWTVAADAGGLGDARIIAIWTFLGVVVTQLVVLVAPIIKSRFERPSITSTPSASPDSAFLIQFAKEQGAVVQRLDDHDETIDMQDRRLDALERWAFDHDPDWRR